MLVGRQCVVRRNAGVITRRFSRAKDTVALSED